MDKKYYLYMKWIMYGFTLTMDYKNKSATIGNSKISKIVDYGICETLIHDSNIECEGGNNYYHETHYCRTINFERTLIGLKANHSELFRKEKIQKILTIL